jgi:hypothetical protein
MPAWICPECGRRFARARQGHECAPALPLEEYLATGPPFERAVVQAVLEHLSRVGEVHVEPLSVGIFLKRAQTFAQLRPMTKWVALSFALPRRVEHPRIVRKPVAYSGRYHIVANIRSPDDLDEQILGWLTEAYLAAPS